MYTYIERGEELILQNAAIYTQGVNAEQVCGRSPAEIAGSSPTGGMDVCFACCALSGRGLCDVLITRPEGSYRLWCVVECHVETS